MLKKKSMSWISGHWLKSALIMKLTLFFVIVSVFAAVGETYSQVTKFTLSGENVKLGDVLNKIKENSEFSFFYNEDLVDTEKRVNYKVVDATIDVLLNQILDEIGLKYGIVDKTIILSPKDKKEEKSVQQQVEKPQKNTISGKVTDETGASIPGVNIRIKGTGIGTITNLDGNYSLELDKEDVIVVFSFVGFITQEITVNAATKTLDVNLVEDVHGVEEVVVIGYGTQKKVNLTGAVDVVSGEELANRPAANVGEILQGVSPNLNISISSLGGEPGASNNWNIRGVGSLSGSSSPLILVDGVEMDPNNLDPESIESVSVLKDAAAAAIYGSRAPFGVVLITTKSGKANKGIRVNVSSNFGFSNPINLPRFAESRDFAAAFNITNENAGQVHKFDDDQLARIEAYNNGTYTPGYDTANVITSIWGGRHEGNSNNHWISDEYYKKNSLRQKHNVSIQGGGELTQFYISAGLFDQEGNFKYGNDEFRRNNIMANITTNPTSWLKFDFKTKYARSTADHPTGPFGMPKFKFFEETMVYWPLAPKYDLNGNILNPFIMALKEGGRENNEINDLWVTVGAEIEPIKGWKTGFSYNYNYWTQRHTKHLKEVWVDVPDGSQGNIGNQSGNKFEEMMRAENYGMFNATSTYDINIDDHYIKGLIGYEQELKNYAELSGSRSELISNTVPAIATGTGAIAVDDAIGHWSTQAVFGRINYNYKEKYLVELNARYNGSSRFQEGSRWGFFPSVSAGYNISRENFWEPMADAVNTFKLRGSYGSLGNQGVPNYLYLSSMTIDPTYQKWTFGGSSLPMVAYAPESTSTNLTWETVTTLNVGLDAGFLNNRLTSTFDWFKRDVVDMFGPAEIRPSVLGASVAQENNAASSTKGFELSIGWKDKVSSDFSYNVRLTFGDSKAKITKFINEEGSIGSWYNTYFERYDWYEGKEIGEIWGYTTDGIIQDEGEDIPNQSEFYSTWGPGDVKYADLDGNDTINGGSYTLADHGDLSIIGNSQPRFNYSISAGFNWKGIDFNMFWQGVGKRDLIVPFESRAGVAFWGLTQDNYGSTVFEQHLDFWRPADDQSILGPNTNGFYPKPYFSSESYKNRVAQSRYLLNAAYARLKNIQIGYTLPKELTQRAHIEKVRFYFSGENMLTITKLTKLLDPETSIASGVRVGQIYPLSKTVSFGINLTF